jgi:hypothetical protein
MLGVSGKHLRNVTTKDKVDTLKRTRLLIITISTVGLLSLFSPTMTVFAWGTGDSTIYYLLFYPILLLSTILTITKIRFGFILTLVLSICYIVLLTPEIGEYIIFKLDNIALFGVLFVPYLTFLVLTPLIVKYMTSNLRQGQLLTRLAIALSFGFVLFALFDRYDKDYRDNIFIELTLTFGNEAKLVCKPGFADTREFKLSTDSKELIETAKKQGDFLHGSYLISNVGIKKRFKFDKLVSVTITDFNGADLKNELTWEKDKLDGDVSFLNK